MQNLDIFIVEDHQVFFEGLKIILNLQEEWDFNIVGHAASGKDTLEMIRFQNADLMFLDLNIPGGDGLQILPKIKRLQPHIRVIALTMFEEPKIVKSAFKAGVDGYILKGNSIEEIYDGVEAVLKGETYMGKGVVLNALPGEERYNTEERRKKFQPKFLQKYNLTARELEVLQLITQALSNKQIAKALYISDQTVSVHRKNIMRKLGVSNTAALLKIAFENQLVL